MAFNRPTLQQLIDRVEGDLKSGLGLVTLLRRSFLKVLARVQAGLTHALFGYLAFIELQAFVDTAEDEYLERHGSIWKVGRKVATFCEFLFDVTGTTGVTITAGTIYRRTDGAEYSVLEEATLAGGVAQLQLVALLAGEASEVFVNDKLSILSPIAGLNSEGTVAEIIIEPEEVEDNELYRARILDRIQNPPAGGAAHDYLQWAKAVPGITRAWVGPQALGPGTVVVYVVNDNDEDIAPGAPKLTEVFDYIEERRPVTANVSVAAPVLLPLDFLISIRPNTAAVQNAVRAELIDLINREAALAGSFKAPGELHTGKILFSQMNEAISIAVGEEDHVIAEINGDATPGDITPADGELIVMGEITWQALA